MSFMETVESAEAHERLARCYALLTEGFDRGPAREAKAALDELAAQLEAEAPGSVRRGSDTGARVAPPTRPSCGAADRQRAAALT